MKHSYQQTTSKLQKDKCIHNLKFTNADIKLYWCLCLHIKIMPKVSHYKTVHFLRYTHPRYMKCLFKNIQKQQNMLKIVYFLGKIQTLRVNNSKCSIVHNISRLFDVLPNFPFPTSETMGDYYLQTWYIRVASRVVKRLNR